MVGEAVANKAQPAPLNILLDWVEGLLFGNLHLRVGPAGDLNDEVENTIVLVSEERDIVERRHDRPILFDIDTMVWIEGFRSQGHERSMDRYQGCWPRQRGEGCTLYG